MSQKFTEVFNAFVGKEVQVTEIPIDTGFGKMTDCYVAPTDTVVAELGRVAKEHGLELEFSPKREETQLTVCKADRLTVRAEKGTDGKYRILPDFRIG